MISATCHPFSLFGWYHWE